MRRSKKRTVKRSKRGGQGGVRAGTRSTSTHYSGEGNQIAQGGGRMMREEEERILPYSRRSGGRSVGIEWRPSRGGESELQRERGNPLLQDRWEQRVFSVDNVDDLMDGVAAAEGYDSDDYPYRERERYYRALEPENRPDLYARDLDEFEELEAKTKMDSKYEAGSWEEGEDYLSDPSLPYSQSDIFESR